MLHAPDAPHDAPDGRSAAPGVPVHAQPSRDVDAARRARVKRGADLCRADPARWSYFVRLTDHLTAQGMDADEADDLAFEHVNGRRA